MATEWTDVALLVGRLLFGALFFYNAVNHFRNRKMVAGYAASRGVPMPEVSVVVTGTVLLLGSLSVVLGVYPRVGLTLLALFLLSTLFLVHTYWTLDDPMQRMGEQTNFHKNVALLGAALALLWIPTPWPLSVDAMA